MAAMDYMSFSLILQLLTHLFTISATVPTENNVKKDQLLLHFFVFIALKIQQSSVIQYGL